MNLDDLCSWNLSNYLKFCPFFFCDKPIMWGKCWFEIERIWQKSKRIENTQLWRVNLNVCFRRWKLYKHVWWCYVTTLLRGERHMSAHVNFMIYIHTVMWYCCGLIVSVQIHWELVFLDQRRIEARKMSALMSYYDYEHSSLLLLSPLQWVCLIY